MKRLRFIIACALATVMLINTSLYTEAAGVDHAYRLVKSYSNTSKAEEVKAIAEVSWKMDMNDELPESKLLEEVYSQLSFKVITEKKGQAYQYQIEALYKDQSLITVDVYLDKKGVVLAIPAIHDKYFYLNWNEVDDLINNIDPTANFPELSYEEYIKLFDVKDSDEYNAIEKYRYLMKIKNYFKDNLTVGEKVNFEDGKGNIIKGQEYTIVYNTKEFYNFAFEILKDLLEDKQVKDFIIAKFSELCNIMVKTGDYEKIGLTKEDIREVKREFVKQYDVIVKEFQDEYDSIKTSLLNNLEYIDDRIETKIVIDNKKRLRSVDTESVMSVDDGFNDFDLKVNQTVVYLYEGVELERPNLQADNSINIATLPEDSMSDVYYEIQNNAINYYMTNEVVMDFAEDVETAIQEINAYYEELYEDYYNNFDEDLYEEYEDEDYYEDADIEDYLEQEEELNPANVELGV